MAFAVSVAITITWIAYVSAAGHWGRVLDNWVAAVTMVFGSFVAGSTPQGGGAVAFPVFTKALEIPAEVARTFSLAIQAIGMTAASLAIIINRRRVEWKAAAIGFPVAAVAFVLAVWLLGDGSKPFRPSIIPGPYVKVTFTLVVGAMALIAYLGSRIAVREVQLSLPALNRRTYSALVILATIGGVASALTGSGADVFLFLYLAILLGVDPKVGVPTSVIVMTGVSLVGTLLLGVFDGQLSIALSADGSSVAAVGGIAVADIGGASGPVSPLFGVGTPLDAGKADLFGLWLAAAPVVAWGAPLGSWVATKLRTRQLVAFVTFLAVTEIVSTVVFVEELRTNPALATFALVGAVVVGGALLWLSRHRLSFFDLAGLAADRSLSREHLDVSEDYGAVLEPDTGAED